MSAGTLTLTNNSDIVSGAGTAFSTELVAGDFVATKVGGITYTLPVKSIESPTSLTLIRVFPGPAQSGAAWNAIPRDTLNQVTSELVAQTTEALRGLNYDKQNWQAVFSVNGNITVKLPDGSSFSGPSWVKIVELLNSIDVDAIQVLADQIHVDAQQVASDTSEVAQNKTASESAADTATQKAAAASQSESSAAQSKTDAAQSAQEAEADRLAIGDVENALAAIQGVATIPFGIPQYAPSRSTIPNGGVAYDGQVLPYSTYTSVKAAMTAGSVPVVTDAQWLADPKLRQAFTEVDAGHFRCPDYNGVQAGSIAQLALVGGTTVQGGIFHGEVPNAKGQIGAAGAGIFANTTSTNGVFSPGASYPNPAQAGTATVTTAASSVTIDLSRASDVYKDTATDVLAARAVGVIWGPLFGRISNPGALDAATLANRIEQVDQRVTSVADTAFIRGLGLQISATTVTVTPGAAFFPGGTSPLLVTSNIVKTIGTTVASTWYHVYLFRNAGQPDIEISTTDPVAYAYPAQQKTGDSSRRYLGSFRVDASGVVRGVDATNGVASLRNGWDQNRMLAGGTSQSRTAIAIGSVVPPTATHIEYAVNNSAQGVPLMGTTADASGDLSNVSTGGKYVYKAVPLRAYPNIYYYYITAPVSGGLYVDIGGYTYAR